MMPDATRASKRVRAANTTLPPAPLATRGAGPLPFLMPRSYSKAARYVLSWAAHRADVVEAEIRLDRGDRYVPATLVRPRFGDGPLPAWIVLHGITRPGRQHVSLLRFIRAVASTGAVVIVPEVPEWRELSLAPAITTPSVLGAIEVLRGNPGVRGDRFGLVGFSFGAPHAVASLGVPELKDSLAGAVGFGGYANLEHTFRYLMTGRHEWQGTVHALRPDPYGRWIVAGNYLARTPGFEDAEDVQQALRRLAALAGDTGAIAWDPRYDPAKVRERAAIPASRRELFDLFAPPSDREPDPVAGEAIAAALLATARRVEPELDVMGGLGDVEGPVHLLHGFRDHLIPFSEAYRLRDELPGGACASATVTQLFGHSGGDAVPSPVQMAREVPAFLNAIAGIFGVV